jgi:putative methanogen marker protein 4
LIDIKDLMERGLRSDLSIGIGLPEPVAEDMRGHLAKKRCKLRVVASNDPHELVSSLKNGEVDGAVRGTLSSAKILEEIREVFSLRQVMRTAVLEDVKGRQFVLTPVGIDEGVDRKSRLELVEATLSYFSCLGWNIDIGVLSKGRPEDWGRSQEIELSLKDGEWLVDTLRRKGMKAEHYSILIEDAVAESDLVVAPDGVSGNLIFRSMHFLGGGKAYGAPIVNLDKVFVDTSRAKCDFAESILLAAGLVQATAGGCGPR